MYLIPCDNRRTWYKSIQGMMKWLNCIKLINVLALKTCACNMKFASLSLGWWVLLSCFSYKRKFHGNFVLVCLYLNVMLLKIWLYKLDDNTNVKTIYSCHYCLYILRSKISKYTIICVCAFVGGCSCPTLH